MMAVLRSMQSLSWAMTLFGAQQVGNLVLADVPRAEVSFRALGEALRGELGPAASACRRAELVQADVVDRLFEALAAGGDPLDPPLVLLEETARLAAAVPGPSLAGLELRNRLQALRTFREAAMRREPDGGPRLEARIAWATSLGPYRALWALEGSGFAHAERAWRGPARDRGLFRGVGTPPLRIRIPLHTGTGLSLARRAVREGLRNDDAELRFALERFRHDCDRHAAPGCARMAFEPLGLVVRQLRPDLLPAADRVLAAADPDLRDRFWHGVGRGLFFAPSQILRRSAGSLARARLEPPYRGGRRNALAGLAWAATLVNVRHPEVVAGWLRGGPDDVFDRVAFSHGVASALLVWWASHGEDETLRRFLDHGPDSAVAGRWRRWVVEPARDALASGAGLEDPAALEAIFRCPDAAPGGDEGAAGPGGAPRDEASTVLDRLGRGLDGWMGRVVDTLDRTRRV